MPAAGPVAPALIHALMEAISAGGSGSAPKGIRGAVFPSSIWMMRLSSALPGTMGGPCAPPLITES